MAENPYPDPTRCCCPKVLGHVLHHAPCPKGGDVEKIEKKESHD